MLKLFKIQITDVLILEIKTEVDITVKLELGYFKKGRRSDKAIKKNSLPHSILFKQSIMSYSKYQSTVKYTNGDGALILSPGYFYKSFPCSKK